MPLYCPILSSKNNVQYVKCLENACAWWDKENSRCILQSLKIKF
jgi:hypothetical protein